MARVPINRHNQLEKLRTGRQMAIIIGGVPVPADRADAVVSVPRDEVNGATELMRTLPRSRFRNFVGEHVALPEGSAERLETFEEGLRLAGFISGEQMLCQSMTTPDKFRVAKRDVSDDLGHGSGSSVKGAVSAYAETGATLTEDPQQYHSAGGSLSSPKSVAWLDGGRAMVARRIMHNLIKGRRPPT